MTPVSLSQMTTSQQQQHFNMQLAAHAVGMPNLSPMVPMASHSSSVGSATNNDKNTDLLISLGVSSSSTARRPSTISAVSSAVAAVSTNTYTNNGIVAVSPTSPSKSSSSWEDRVIRIAQSVMGGCQYNGFLRACSSAQRIKRQRARQISAIHAKMEQLKYKSRNANTGITAAVSTNSNIDEVADVAAIKRESLNVNTVKKIQNEINDGMHFCNKVITMIETALQMLDPSPHPSTANATSREQKEASRKGNAVSKTNTIQKSSSKTASTPATTTTTPSLCNPSNFNPCATSVASSTGANANPMLNSQPPPYHQQSSSNPYFAGNIGPVDVGVGAVMPQVDATLLQQQQQQLRSQQQQPQHHHHQQQQILMRSHGITSVTDSPSQGNNNNMFSSMTQQETSSSPQGPSKALSKTANQCAETAEAGNPNGSTFRKNRKRDPSKPAPGSTDEALLCTILGTAGGNNTTTKKKVSKKEASYKCFAISRFRSLCTGDYVAARLTSRDLWILARVVQDWQCPPSFNALEHSSLSESKRDTLFLHNPVYIRDVEDKLVSGDATSKAQAVPRHLVLPLPRSYNEASEWCTRCRKGSRAFAMYPSTTSLYGATVIDNTTYCRNEDDIVVVEFDGDEDDFGNMPQRHIPARFVTLVPLEFPAAASTNNSNNNASDTKGQASSSSHKKGKSAATDAASLSVSASGGSANKHASKRKSSGTKSATLTQGKKSKNLSAMETYGNSDFEKDMFDVFYNHI